MLPPSALIKGGSAKAIAIAKKEFSQLDLAVAGAYEPYAHLTGARLSRYLGKQPVDAPIMR